jgi:hypothetical protein
MCWQRSASLTGAVALASPRLPPISTAGPASPRECSGTVPAPVQRALASVAAPALSAEAAPEQSCEPHRPALPGTARGSLSGTPVRSPSRNLWANLYNTVRRVAAAGCWLWREAAASLLSCPAR